MPTLEDVMAGTTDTNQETLDEWRTGQFVELGFLKSEAVQLAVGRDHEGWPISIHSTKKLLGQGCSHSLALRILL